MGCYCDETLQWLWLSILTFSLCGSSFRYSSCSLHRLIDIITVYGYEWCFDDLSPPIGVRGWMDLLNFKQFCHIDSQIYCCNPTLSKYFIQSPELHAVIRCRGHVTPHFSSHDSHEVFLVPLFVPAGPLPLPSDDGLQYVLCLNKHWWSAKSHLELSLQPAVLYLYLKPGSTLELVVSPLESRAYLLSPFFH